MVDRFKARLQGMEGCKENVSSMKPDDVTLRAAEAPPHKNMLVYCKFLKLFSKDWGDANYSSQYYGDFWRLYSLMSQIRGPFLTLAMQKFEITFLKFRPHTFIPVLAKICAEEVRDMDCANEKLYSEELHRLAEEVMVGEFTIPK